MTEFVRPTEDKITIAGDTDTSIELSVPIKDGTAGINLLYSNSTGNFIELVKLLIKD